MLPILTPAESADLDRRSAERGVGVDTLMENAGRAVASVAETVAGGAYGRRAVVVCGKGNNGGDGLVAARHLERRGMRVTAVLMAGPQGFGGAAAENFRRLDALGARWRSFDPEALHRELGRADVLVDALFGTGFRGRPEGEHEAAIRGINEAAAPVVAVDIPSGCEGETGAVRGEAVVADVTATFGALKPGLVFHPGAAHAGVVEVTDIGFPPDLVATELWLLERADVAAILPERPAEIHKRAAGTVLVIAGSRRMTGAPVLTARGAYRAGAGLVRVAVPEAALGVVQAGVPEATFLPLPDGPEGAMDERAREALMEAVGGVHAVAVGPGLGVAPATAALVRALVAEIPVPLVIDADALNAFAGQAALLAQRSADAVITPHAGEFGRLAGISAAEVLEDRVGHARKMADELGCTVLLKGSRTVVAEPGGTATVNPTGGPSLATGGTGDVLTGAIAALMAQGLGPPQAARAAAFVHGIAGRLAGDDLGPGVVASDVAERLPAAIRDVIRGR